MVRVSKSVSSILESFKSTFSKTPALSPATIVFTYNSAKTLGCFAIAWERLMPPATSLTISLNAIFRARSSVCSVSTPSPSIIGIPALRMVENCREKIISAWGFALPRFLKIVSEAAFVFSALKLMLIGRYPNLASWVVASISLAASNSPLTSLPFASAAL